MKTTSLLAVILVLAALNAPGAMVITDDTAAPTENLLSGGVQGVGGSGLRNRYYDQNDGSSGVDHGQFFTLGTIAADTVLDAITVQAHFDVGSDVLNQSYRLQIWSTSGGTLNTLLADASGIIPSTFSGFDYLRMDLTAEDEISLSSDTQYGFMVFFNERGIDTGSNATRRSFQLAKTTGDPLVNYAGGDMFRREFNGGTTPTASRPTDASGINYDNTTDNAADLVFYVQGAVVPEPGTAVLLLGAVGLLGMRRHRAAR